MKKYLTRHVSNKNYIKNISDIPDLNYSKISFKEFNKLGTNNEILRLKERLIEIFRNDQYTDRQKYKCMFDLINSPQCTYEDLQKVYDILDDRIKEFINRLANNKDKMNNPVFSFNKEDESKERNVVFLSDRAIVDSAGKRYKVSSLIKDFNEDVDKPPIFETHVSTPTLNKYFVKPGGHAFIGFRFTQYENGEYKRKCFKIGYGLYENRGVGGIGAILNIRWLCSFPNRLMDDMFWGSAISTQTAINVAQSKLLIKNIKLYFQKYPMFNVVTRNCNTFTRTMAREIGLGNIAKLHNTISPSSAANRISKELSKGRNLDGFRSDFSTDKFKYGVKVGYEVSSNEFSGEFRNLMGKTTGWEKRGRKPFMKTATDIARQDLSIFDKLNKSKNFRSSEAKEAVQGISNSIIELNYMIEKGFPESFVRSYCESIKKNIHRAISITGKKHLNLNVYLMRVYNLIDYTGFKYKSPNFQGNISENENIE